MTFASRTLLLGVVIALPVAFAAHAHLAAGADDAASTVETIQLDFAWPDPLELDVQTTVGRVRRHFLPDATPSEIAFRYRLEARGVGDEILVTFGDLSLGTEDAPSPDEIGPAIVQFAGVVPNIRVSPDGTFIGVVDASASADRMRRFLLEHVPDVEQNPLLGQVFDLISSEEFLVASASELWDSLVGAWFGEELELGASYEFETTAPHPMAPGAEVSAIFEFTLENRVPCRKGATKRGCVELVTKSSFDPDDLKRTHLEMSRTLQDDRQLAQANKISFQEFSEETRLIAEPNTLLPHRLEYRKTIEMRVGPSESDRDGRVEYLISEFSYP